MMNQLNGLSCGENFDLQLDLDGEIMMYAGRVNEIENGIFSIEIDDKDLTADRIFEGMSALLVGQTRENRIRLPVRVESARNLPTLIIKQNNFRSDVRADGFVKLKCEGLAEKDFLEKREQYLHETLPAYTGEDPAAKVHSGRQPVPEATPDDLSLPSEISPLSQKLGHLQRLIFNSEEIDLLEQNPVKVNISGSGMRLYSDSPFRIGDLLDIKMILPISPFAIIKAIGLVVRMHRLSPNPSLNGQMKNIALKFLAISEDHREAIIHCVFTWQRKNIRENKNGSHHGKRWAN